MLPAFLLPDNFRQARLDAKKKDRARRKKEEFLTWSPKMKWDKRLNIRGESYHPPELFDGIRESSPYKINELDEDQYVDSPDGNWRYCVKDMPAWETLNIYQGNRRGTVMFNSPVRMPAIHKRDYTGEFDRTPYMSITPNEIFTLRPGTRLAKGHVIIAGLGMGYQLREVAKKKSVTQITVIEISQELVDWLLPIIKPHVAMDFEMVVGDAKELLLDMKADVALVDIYPSYGSNDCYTNLRGSCDGIGKVWIWGASNFKDEDWC